MKRRRYLLGAALLMLSACSTNVKKATGYSEPDLGWLFLEKGPYTLETKVQAAPGIPREEIFSMLRYFDVKNFAPRVTCPVYMAFGLQDPTCPPHTNFSIYNNLGSKEKHYFCVPTCGHAMWLEPAWPPVRDAFIAEKLN